METKSDLNGVETKEMKVEVLDKLREVRAKHSFISDAISALWGSDHSIYGEETVLGCQFLMDDVGDQLREIHKVLDPKYAP